MKYLQRVLNYLEDSTKVKNPDRSNTGRLLWEVFLWQEVSNRAKKKLDKAWTALNDNGLISDDDKLREATGEKVVLETDFLSCRVKVDQPRETFDKEMFIQKVAKKYKLPVGSLQLMSVSCVSKTKPVLQKRVVEKEISGVNETR